MKKNYQRGKVMVYSQEHDCYLNSFTNRKIRKMRKSIWIFYEKGKEEGFRIFSLNSVRVCHRIGLDELPF